MIGHGLVQVDGISESLRRVGGDRRPFDTAVCARQHSCPFFCRQHPHVLLRHHSFRETDQAAILAIVNIDVTGFAGMNYARDDLAVLALYAEQPWWACATRVHTSWAIY